MARVDQAPEDRHTETVKVSQIINCEECDIEFEAIFDTGAFDIEMVDEEISADVECPNGHRFHAEYTGWTHHTDAG
jgi:hypothetical protein